MKKKSRKQFGDSSEYSTLYKTEQPKRRGYNFWIESSDTSWVDPVYEDCFRLAGSAKHRNTFNSILENVSISTDAITICLSKGHYRHFKKKSKEIVVSQISSICRELFRRDYITLDKGYNHSKDFRSASIIQATEKLLNMMPPDLSYRIRREGLIIPKEFTPPSVYPEDVQDAENVLFEYNQMVEPWNMLYASYKGGFDINGRFTGSDVIFMKKDTRKRLKMDDDDTLEIDVTGCLPSILYASELQTRLSDDVYDIDEAPRKVAKTSFVIMLNAKSEKSARFAIQKMITDKHRGQYRAAPIMKALSKKHHALEDWFYSGIGCKLMNLESRCMCQFLKEMVYEGIKVYPVYDCAVAKVFDREIVESAFRRAFTVNGIELPVH